MNWAYPAGVTGAERELGGWDDCTMLVWCPDCETEREVDGEIAPGGVFHWTCDDCEMEQEVDLEN